MKIYDYKGRKNLCGNRVKEARARLNITQTDLAARLQVAGITMERDSVCSEMKSSISSSFFNLDKIPPTIMISSKYGIGSGTIALIANKIS